MLIIIIFLMQKPRVDFLTLSFRILQIWEAFIISHVCLLFHSCCSKVVYLMSSKVIHVLQGLRVCSPFELPFVRLSKLLFLSSCVLQVLALRSVLAQLMRVLSKGKYAPILYISWKLMPFFTIRCPTSVSTPAFLSYAFLPALITLDAFDCIVVLFVISVFSFS